MNKETQIAHELRNDVGGTDKFVNEQIRKSIWREEIVPPAITGLPCSIIILRAARKTNLIKFDWHGNRETFCPPIWYDLAIGSGACGYGCRICFLVLTFRALRDPLRPVVYENVDDFEQEVRKWLLNPERRYQHTLGLGIDCADSLLYEGVTGFARRIIPLFSDEATNPTGNKLILLTKSANTHYLEGLPTENVAVTFSLNPEPIADLWEGKLQDGTRLTPHISSRLEACTEAQKMGFETRWRLDPILPADGWEENYREFLNEAVDAGCRPTYITLGTYREKNAQLGSWAKKWELPEMEWSPSDLSKEGTHWHIGESERVRIYQSVNKMIERAFSRTTDRPAVELCKETHEVRRQVGFSCTAKCNCLV